MSKTVSGKVNENFIVPKKRGYSNHPVYHIILPNDNTLGVMNTFGNLNTHIPQMLTDTLMAIKQKKKRPCFTHVPLVLRALSSYREDSKPINKPWTTQQTDKLFLNPDILICFY